MDSKIKIDQQSNLEFFSKFFYIFLALLFGVLAVVNITGPKASSNNWVIFLAIFISISVLTYGLHKRLLFAWGFHSLLILGFAGYYFLSEFSRQSLWLSVIVTLSIALQLFGSYNVLRK